MLKLLISSEDDGTGRHDMATDIAEMKRMECNPACIKSAREGD